MADGWNLGDKQSLTRREGRKEEEGERGVEREGRGEEEEDGRLEEEQRMRRGGGGAGLSAGLSSSRALRFMASDG